MRFFASQRLENPKGFFILFLSYLKFLGYPFFILFLSSPDFSSILDILFLTFFYPLVLDLDILVLSSPDFSSILDILFLSFFYPFLILFYILLAAKWIKLASPGTKGKGLRKSVGFYPFFIRFLSFFYPPSCKMDQNWLPQVQKAKG